MINGMDQTMSVMSKSASEAASTQAANSLSKTSNHIDPLFDKMTQIANLPSIIYYFFLLIILIQLMFISSWPSQTLLWKSNTISENFIKYLTYIATYSPEYSTESNMLIGFLIYTVLFILFFGCFIMQLVIFNKYRRFNKKSLFITRFLIELVPLILIIPLAHLTGSTFIK